MSGWILRGGALFSECERYRYTLTRRLTMQPDNVGRWCNFIMLNPSTASEALDDPTIRRCMRFTRDWGYDHLVVTNLFAWRDTNPSGIRRAVDPIGERNDKEIRAFAEAAHLSGGIVVCAWGTHGKFLNRGEAVAEMLSHLPLMCIKRVGNNAPGHPLYLAANLQPILWREGRTT